MSVQDDESAAQDADHNEETEQKLTEKPEPDEGHKEKAAEMMEAYEEKPTIVLPGTGGSVSGTAVNDWLDEDGNPRHEKPEGGPDSQAQGDDSRDEQALQDQIEKDKALNEQLKEAATADNKGEKR
ncbi:hypothetical protein [Mycobacterium paraseoulense]|uniref:Uncharacterized protein n=1 Tax=Mycobacterium paraseoulense TaxID=590652 RepID=A0A1X0I8Z0_9MYCO|nr:hypothetical protein [Mycobacterium paraseoulense]MCV7397547.1 hypothetical protein [Mycobacterium paraseoulense]ORB39668.1 hypothetical protein BST39_15200 [Mycobacterium paraseoulense]BBZ70158.1 hypothetical protein MPRS_12510 [Mycobacterium paraseoulense]